MKRNLAAEAAPSSTHQMGKQARVLRRVEFLAVFHGLALGYAAQAGGFAAEQIGVKRGTQLEFWKRQHMVGDHPPFRLHSPHGKPLGMAESPAAALEQTGTQQGDLSPEMGEAFSPAMLQARALQLSCLLRVQDCRQNKAPPAS